MMEALMKLFGKKDSSAKIAHNRLRVVLVHDRLNISPEIMENIRNDIVQVISKYVDIDMKAMEMSLANDEDSVALVANIPVSRMKHDKGGSK